MVWLTASGARRVVPTVHHLGDRLFRAAPFVSCFSSPRSTFPGTGRISSARDLGRHDPARLISGGVRGAPRSPNFSYPRGPNFVPGSGSLRCSSDGRSRCATNPAADEEDVQVQRSILATRRPVTSQRTTRHNSRRSHAPARTVWTHPGNVDLLPQTAAGAGRFRDGAFLNVRYWE